jgi:hypothetical protein
MRNFIKIIILMIFATAPAFANQADYGQINNRPGIYIGLQGGYSYSGYSESWFKDAFKDSSITINSVGSIDNSGVVGRIYAGCDFNKYLALEVGIFATPDIEFNDITATQDDVNVNMSESFSQAGLDLLAKGKLPLRYGFTAFAQGGLGFIINGDITVTAPNGEKFEGDQSSGTTVPVLGGGVSYNFTQAFSANATYMHYFSNSDVCSIDLAVLGIAYKWNF